MRVFSFVLVCILCILSACGDSSKPNHVQIKASHSFANGLFFLTNGDTYDYTDVDITINGDYKCHVDRIAAGQDFTVAISSFLDGDNRFDISQKAITEIKVSAETPEGFGFQMWNK